MLKGLTALNLCMWGCQLSMLENGERGPSQTIGRMTPTHSRAKQGRG